MSDELPDILAEIKIMIKQDKIIWDIGKLTLPEVVFWLETVKHMIMGQVAGGNDVQQSS